MTNTNKNICSKDYTIKDAKAYKAYKAKITGSNMKLGKTLKVGTFNKMAGGGWLYFDNIVPRNDVDVILKSQGCHGSCKGCCSGCFNKEEPSKSPCYVFSAYNRYPSVRLGHARNTIAMRLNLLKVFEDLDGQLSRARRKYDIIRIHQSGELESLEEMIQWLYIAEKHPETIFYIYTKNYDIIYNIVSQRELPSNLYVLLSVWHESGLNEYKIMRQYKNIKAFVYMDGFDYNKHGLEVSTMCTAYNKEGKMDHRVTCDKCRKCFNSKYDIIGCYDH